MVFFIYVSLSWGEATMFKSNIKEHDTKMALCFGCVLPHSMSVVKPPHPLQHVVLVLNHFKGGLDFIIHSKPAAAIAAH